MKIRFAPIHLSKKRRLQTLAVFAYVHLIGFGGAAVVLFSIFSLLYLTYFRWVYLAYLIWVFFLDTNVCDRGSRPSGWVRNWTWWKYLADYFPINFVILEKAKFDPKRNYLCCCFPHGMIATGVFTTFSTEARNISKQLPNHKIYTHTLKQNFFVPILRELLLYLGAVSASKDSLNYILSDPKGGNITALVVGGAQEAFHSRPKEYNFFLRNRKGFVKIALKNGSPIVPVLSFGEPDIIDHIKFEEGSFFRKLQLTVKKYFGFVPLVPIGRGIFQYSYGIMPQRRRIVVVVGEPIEVEKVENPSQEQIDKLHKDFIEELTNLFESQKEHYLENSKNVHINIL